MSRSGERLSKRWSTVNVPRRNSSSSEESSLVAGSVEGPVYAKNASTPLRNRWSDSEEINRSSQNQRDASEVSEEESEEEESGRSKGHDGANRGKRQDDQERFASRQKRRRKSRGKQRQDRRHEESDSRKQKTSSSSSKRHGEGDGDRSKRKHRCYTGDDELPITEILKRSQENPRMKYEHQLPLPELTTDKIYVQHRGGFSAMKIRSRSSQLGQKLKATGNDDDAEHRDTPPIKVAIMVQQLWKSSGLVFQGLLGGMALMHFIMLQVFFDASVEFVEGHSTICEIYTNIFSFLVTLCIVSALDKFDLARFDLDHLREIYFDYNRAVLAVPLYLVVFCLHQVCVNTDNRLSLVHYYRSNYSLWENATDVQTLLTDLNSWQKISISKDVLAVLAWFFISLDTKDDAFLIHLQSMEKYASNEEPKQ
nr:uncharacterized protein LOC116427954 [Nomia melanderi]